MEPPGGRPACGWPRTCGISVRTGLSAVAGRLRQPRPAATARDDSGPRRATLLSRKDRDRVSPEEAVKRMRRYEMMIILDPSLEERTVQPSLDQFLRVVTTSGGSVDKVDVWGRRRLSYEIDKKTEGIYTVVDLVAEPDAVKELDRQLNLNEADLLTKILR